ncbi:hypothetical protein RKD38_004155 [Streptomyces ambofaciens]
MAYRTYRPARVALPLPRFGGFVVEPDGGAQAPGALGGQGERVAGGVAEAGGDLAVAGVEGLLGEQVGFRDAVLPDRQSVQDPPVGHGAAGHGLDVAEVGAGESEADGGAGAVSVGRFQHDEPAPGADQGGSGAQYFLESVGEGVRADQAFGQFVQGREVRYPAGEPVLEQGPGGTRSARVVRDGRGVRGGGFGRLGGARGGGRDSVCGGRNR